MPVASTSAWLIVRSRSGPLSISTPSVFPTDAPCLLSPLTKSGSTSPASYSNLALQTVSFSLAGSAVRERMRALAAQYPRYGYRRVRIFLARDGHPMSTDRAHRLWRAERLQLPRRRPRRRIAASRPRPVPATGANQVWAYDFVFDACANGQKLKCLTIIDEWTREALAIDVAGSIRSGRVIDVLARLVSVHGAPKYMRSDNGPEFIATAVLRWLTDEGIETAHI